MINFSVRNQAFYDLTFNYPELPNDLIEITAEQHQELLNAINSGCIIFADLTYSEPKLSRFHAWSGSEWVDSRTPEETEAHNRSLLPKLSKRQFALYLYDYGLYDSVMTALDQNPRFKIEYETAKELERLSPTVENMIALLEWTDEQVDAMWQEALSL